MGRGGLHPLRGGAAPRQRAGEVCGELPLPQPRRASLRLQADRRVSVKAQWAQCSSPFLLPNMCVYTHVVLQLPLWSELIVV